MQRSQHSRVCYAAELGVLIMVIALIGCEANATNVTSGQVIDSGQPVKIGAIRFTPDVDQGNQGPTVTVAVSNGEFTTSGTKASISPGPNIARIEVVPEAAGEQDSTYYEMTVNIPEGGKTDLVLDTAQAKKAR
ncbi:hypothetical protein ACYFX5_03515 [Bremerella sp. T1]|uniref:hypothetical protein n=1 Tax=Bremerella sp. TYQ1 TaxID=3119568 RepID=UPI001CCF3A46|nr:hypothetical protein [Bremerella volcania]UBM37339.1 hypothetical protein LA756_05470 [Bremerella volcania]